MGHLQGTQPWLRAFGQVIGTHLSLPPSALHPSPILTTDQEVCIPQIKETMKVDPQIKSPGTVEGSTLLCDKSHGPWGQWSKLPGLASLCLRSREMTWLSHPKPVSQDSSGLPAQQVPGFKGPSVS